MSKEVIKAVFFDQDRTLLTVASNNIYQKCIQLTQELFSLSNSLIESEFKRLFELNQDSTDPKKHRFLALLKEIIISQKNSFNSEKWQKIEDLYYSLIKESVEINLGVLEFLKAANEMGLLLFVFTEDTHNGIEAKLKHLQLEGYFNHILTSDDVGITKPNLKYYTGMLEKRALTWTSCVFVGDKWEKDCSIPHERGGFTVLFGEEDERADYCINDMRDLVKIIKELNDSAEN